MSTSDATKPLAGKISLVAGRDATGLLNYAYRRRMQESNASCVTWSGVH